MDYVSNTFYWVISVLAVYIKNALKFAPWRGTPEYLVFMRYFTDRRIIVGYKSQPVCGKVQYWAPSCGITSMTLFGR